MQTEWMQVSWFFEVGHGRGKFESLPIGPLQFNVFDKRGLNGYRFYTPRDALRMADFGLDLAVMRMHVDYSLIWPVWPSGGSASNNRYTVAVVSRIASTKSSCDQVLVSFISRCKSDVTKRKNSKNRHKRSTISLVNKFRPVYGKLSTEPWTIWVPEIWTQKWQLVCHFKHHFAQSYIFLDATTIATTTTTDNVNSNT